MGQGQASGLAELDLARGLAHKLDSDATADLRTLSCPNCGAVIELEGASHATECPFCATPGCDRHRHHAADQPQGLIPFALSEEVARAALGKWLGKRWFAPNGLMEYAESNLLTYALTRLRIATAGFNNFGQKCLKKFITSPLI